MTYDPYHGFSEGDIIVVGKDSKLHKAKFTTRKRNRIDPWGHDRICKYLYLCYRDGKTVRQKYLGKMA